MSLFVCVCFCVPACAYLYVSMHLYTSQCVLYVLYVFVCVLVCWCDCMFVCLCVYMFVCLQVCQFACLFVYIDVFACLLVCVSEKYVYTHKYNSQVEILSIV